MTTDGRSTHIGKGLCVLLVCFLTHFMGCDMAVAQCKNCKVDTTGGYISIADTVLHNPVCNFEVLTAAHVALSEKLKISRSGIKFYPPKLDTDYDNSGDDRGHVISWEDLAYSYKTALASYDLRRNLAPEPHVQNVGTKYASEELGRAMATKYGYIFVYGGTIGTVGVYKGINKPAYYWTVIVTPDKTLCYYMPTTGAKVTKQYLNDPEINVSKDVLIGKIGFDPQVMINEAVTPTPSK